VGITYRKDGGHTDMTLGELVKKAREEHSLSQKELGEQIGVWDTYIGQIEKGEKIPSDEICVKLAHVLLLDERKLLLLAYKNRASDCAKELFDQIDRLMNDPVVGCILAEKDLLDLDLLNALREDGSLREALRHPVWRGMLAASYQMKNKDIPGLIDSVKRMSERQWEALSNMMDVLTQGN
jgi:transcriptional regulator with XRE-family HTH domain